MIQPFMSTALNDSTYTAITLGDNQSCTAIGFWTEDGTAFYLATDSSGTDEILTLANQALGLAVKTAKGDTLFYAKSSAGTPNLALVITK